MASKVTQDASKSGPTWPKMVTTMAQYDPKTSEEGPKTTYDDPWTAEEVPRRSKKAPREPPRENMFDDFSMLPFPASESPRQRSTPRSRPEKATRAPRVPQEPPKTAHEGPKTAQEGPWRGVKTAREPQEGSRGSP